MKANASITSPGRGAYGVRFESPGVVSWCSEHQAGLDPRGPVAWLEERYPDHTFKLILDGGAAYRDSLYDDLFGGNRG